MENTNPALKTPKKRGAAAATNDDSPQPAKKRSPVKKANTATNIQGDTNGDIAEPATPSPKKRASPKKKNAAEVNVKLEKGESDGETEGLEPVTPKKGKRAPAKGKGTKTNGDTNANDESAETTEKSASPTKGSQVEGTTVHNTPRKRQAPKKELAAPRGIPTSWQNADDADKMLIEMKQRGDGWNEIRAAWKAATGQETASRYALLNHTVHFNLTNTVASTLPNRYNRIKVNMMHLKDGDVCSSPPPPTLALLTLSHQQDQHLLLAKKEIEDAYNANFWTNVASNMERRGADKYPSAFLQKTFKELETAGKAVINPTTTEAPAADSDFGVDTVNDAPNGTTTNGQNDTNGDDVVMKQEEDPADSAVN